jgi:hypothetical protein
VPDAKHDLVCLLLLQSASFYWKSYLQFTGSVVSNSRIITNYVSCQQSRSRDNGQRKAVWKTVICYIWWSTSSKCMMTQNAMFYDWILDTLPDANCISKRILVWFDREFHRLERHCVSVLAHFVQGVFESANHISYIGHSDISLAYNGESRMHDTTASPCSRC